MVSRWFKWRQLGQRSNWRMTLNVRWRSRWQCWWSCLMKLRRDPYKHQKVGRRSRLNLSSAVMMELLKEAALWSQTVNPTYKGFKLMNIKQNFFCLYKKQKHVFFCDSFSKNFDFGNYTQLLTVKPSKIMKFRTMKTPNHNFL